MIIKNIKTNNRIEIVEELPIGWRIIEGALTAPNGTKWICNNKSIFGTERQTKLLIINEDTFREVLKNNGFKYKLIL